MRLSDIDIRLLRVFKTVAKAGGFAKAQAELGISQPAISSHIANLEQRLDIRLCERGPKGFALTPQGHEVLVEVDVLLQQLDFCANRLNEIGKKPKDQLRIGVVDCLIADQNNPLPEALRHICQPLKDVRLRVGVYDYLDCMTELRAGRIDLAVFGIEPGDHLPEDLEVQHIYDEDSGLYCHPSHPCAQPLSPEALNSLLAESRISAHSFLLNPIGETFKIGLLEENADISQGSVEASAYLALAGTHVGVLQVHYANQWVASGALVHIGPDQYRIVSQFHAARLRRGAAGRLANDLWRSLVRRM